MKTISIITTLILLAVFTGCSDNPVGTDVISQQNISDKQSNQYLSNDNLSKDTVLLWSLDELSVHANNENLVENKITYSNPPFMYVEDYLITFDVFTDADEYTNYYSPKAKITMDQETVYEAHNFPDLNPQGICHREVNLDNVRFDNLTFYVSLCKVPNVPSLQVKGGCCLKLLNLKVYLLD